MDDWAAEGRHPQLPWGLPGVAGHSVARSAAEGGALNRQRLVPQWGLHWVAPAGLTLPRIAACECDQAQSGSTRGGSHSSIAYAEIHSDSVASCSHVVQLWSSSAAAPGRRIHMRIASAGGGVFHPSPLSGSTST